eukprot:1158888-Pyramimonas_sp.AAC.1
MSAIAMMSPTCTVSLRANVRSGAPRAAMGMHRVAPKAVRAAVRMAATPKLAVRTQFGGCGTRATFNARTVVPVARKSVVTRAEGAAAAASPDAPKGNTLVLGALFAGWYAFNIYFNIYNKQILTVFPYPYTNTNFQFLSGMVICAIGWATGLIARPKTNAKQLMAILPLA